MMKENLYVFRRAPSGLASWRYAAAFNGGPGYLLRELKEAGGVWEWTVVRAFCEKFRTEPACQENIAYPAKIEGKINLYTGY